jgi:predicted nucleotidyltransferase
MVKTKADIDNIIKRYAKALSEKIDVDKVILVGPYAKGTADEWSDIEFAVISKDFEELNHLERLKVLSRATMNVDLFLMPVGGYTPDEYEHPEKTLHLRGIKSRGKIVYESE